MKRKRARITNDDHVTYDNDENDDDLMVQKMASDTVHDAIDEKQLLAKQKLFDSIFDDIYEVELPSTLWAVHRDPERKYIVFSEFDVKTMTAAKVLHITDTCDIKAYYHTNEIPITKRNDDLSFDMLAEVLGELDDEL